MNSLVDISNDNINQALLESVNTLHAGGMSWDQISIDLFGYKNATSMKNKCNGNDTSAIDTQRLIRAMFELSKQDIWVLHRFVIDFTRFRVIRANHNHVPKRTVEDLASTVVFALAEIERGLKLQNAQIVNKGQRQLEAVLDRVHREKVEIQNVLFSKVG